MNPTTTTTTDPLPPPPQPHRSSFTCDRHPEDNFSGFCPSCLFERLSTLDPQSSPPSSRRPSTSSAIKSLFKIPSTAEKLTKSKSFSASKNEAFSGLFEPQRKSCDVRVRNINTNTNTNTNANATLSALFTIENEFKSSQNPINQQEQQHHQDEIRVLENPNVPDINEEEPDTEIIEEIRVLEKPNVPNINEEEEQVIRERNEEEEGEDLNLKTMKDHINIDSQPKKASVSFWSAASVFSKKWQKWRGGKQKVKKTTTGAKSAMEKPISRHFRETQSEIADYGFGRRSCDIDPRFSLDAGRISFDDPRYSFDEPRASWDGYMIGRTFPRLPPMVSLVEDAPASAVHVSRSDASIPVEEVETVNCINEIIPGGSIQTKEYYADSSSRRRKSFDRSSSIRRTAASVVAGIDESKGNTNSKVSPATIDSFNGVKNNSNPLRDDCSGAFGLKENICGNENGERKELKKSRRWNWKIWGFIQKRNGNGLNRDEAEEGYSRGSGIGIERSYSQSWQEMRGENLGYNPRMNRSNSSVSWRSSNNNGGTFSSGRKSNVETYGNGKTKGDEFDNGFYWGPLSSSRRGGAWMSKPNGSNSIARSVLRMY